MPRILGLRRQLFISAILYLGQIVLGYTQSWPGSIIPKLEKLEDSPLPHFLTPTQISLVGSLSYIGAIPGPIFSGWFSNYKGRKPCFILSGIATIIAFTILSTAKNLTMLYCGRILNTFGAAIIGVNNVVYLGEVAGKNIRGSLLAALGIFSSMGSIMVFSIAPFLPYYVSTYIGLALSVIFTVAIVMIPESPFYYILKDEEDKAIKNLHRLGRMEEKENLFEMKKLFKSTNAKMDWIELFTLRTNKKALFIVISINILQQLSGGIPILFFSASIFEMAESSVDSNIAMVIIGCIQLIGSILSPLLFIRTGTKNLLLFSSALCSMSMFFMGLYFYLQYLENSLINHVKWLPLVIFTLFFIGYECGLSHLPLNLIGEMFTINVRSKGSAVVLCCSWLFGFLLATAFGSIVKYLGAYVVFWFFSISCACAYLFTMFCVPETKGKSLLEIQQFLGNK